MRHLKRLLFGIILLSSFGFLFGTKESEDKKEPELDIEANSINSKGSDEKKAEELKLMEKQTFKKYFIKTMKEFAIPLWIPILSIVTTGVVIILVVLTLYNYLAVSSFLSLKESILLGEYYGYRGYLFFSNFQWFLLFFQQ
uniref:Uncharacterized protein n=1 Tax=Rhizophagus irregularis (strain DAOM 181602 / DAOM 197198 / MUCL 43194) TaxID=747089 RepID=U9UPY6_RHIID